MGDAVSGWRRTAAGDGGFAGARAFDLPEGGGWQVGCFLCLLEGRRADVEQGDSGELAGGGGDRDGGGARGAVGDRGGGSRACGLGGGFSGAAERGWGCDTHALCAGEWSGGPG